MIYVSDDNECSRKNAGCSQECVNTDGSYYCTCSEGYEQDADIHACNNVNECKTGAHNCKDVCVDTPGSYNCTCHDGFKPQQDQVSCGDIDECRTQVHLCSYYCNNTVGSYTCFCPTHLMLASDKKSCIGKWHYTSRWYILCNVTREYIIYTSCSEIYISLWGR